MLSLHPALYWIAGIALFVGLALLGAWLEARRARGAVAGAAPERHYWPGQPRLEAGGLLPRAPAPPALSLFEPAHNQDNPDDDLHPEKPHAPPCVCGADATSSAPLLSTLRFGRTVPLYRGRAKGPFEYCSTCLRVAEADVDRALLVDVAAIQSRAAREIAVLVARRTGRALRARVLGSLSKEQRPPKPPKAPAAKALHARGASLSAHTNGAGKASHANGKPAVDRTAS